MKKLIGKNIYLRPVLEKDMEKFANFMNDFEGTVYTNTISEIYTEKEEREYFQNDSSRRQFAIIDRIEDKLLGLVELFSISWVHRVAELGIFIGDPKGRNRGLGYEAIMLALDYAFDILNLKTVHLTVSEFNQRGIALYKKCGFQHAGRLRNHRIFRGRYYDTLYMDILAEEHKSYCLREELDKIIQE
ncbi:MAG: GNAT family protein [Tissierellia bacterium]|nr:GNAT family protein [Tissierellia bacterium]